MDATAQILEIILLFYAKRQNEPELARQKQQLFSELTEKGFARESQILFAFDAIFSGMAQAVHIDLRHAALSDSSLILQLNSIGSSVELLSQSLTPSQSPPP